MKVLVVDDDPNIRSMAEIILTRAGHDILLADSAKDGILLFKKERDNVDVVMIDLSLEDMCGVDVLRHMRLLRPDIQGIISTGYDFTETNLPDDIKEHTTCLRKPYSAAALRDQVVGGLLEPSC